MISISRILEKIDHYFLDKKESDKWLLILSIAAVIVFVVYSYLLPYAENAYRSSEMHKHRLERSIAEHTAYFDSITVSGDRDYYIKKYDRDIRKKDEQIHTLDQKINYINRNLDTLSSMLFNKKSWSVFLDSIAGNAKLNNIDIRFIKNRYVDNNGSFGHVLEIEIGSSGTYRDIIKFINELEQNSLVTEVCSSKLQRAGSAVSADINLSVWGINR